MHNPERLPLTRPHRAATAAGGSHRTAVRLCLAIGVVLMPVCAAATAAEGELRVEKVVDGVYAIVGALGQRSADNLGNNATFGFVVTDQGVVLIDSGGTREGARALASAIGTVTDKPVRLVINTGGQDHRWLGNAYFREQGARVVAAAKAVADQKARARDQMIVARALVGDAGFAGTHEAFAEEVFDSELDLSFGGVHLHLRHPGPAHTPGDAFVWLPEQRVMFAGDIVYVERMPAVTPESDTDSWLAAFDAMAAYRPAHIVPGHGGVTTLDEARRDTHDYLIALRETVSEFRESGGDIADVGTLDFSDFGYLENYPLLKGRNAQQVYEELEWE